MQEGLECWLCDPETPSRPQNANDSTSIRADLLRLLILGGTKGCGIHERGVRLFGGWIVGTLDLSYCTARGATTLDFCRFPAKPQLEQGRFKLLSLDDSQLDQGLFAPGMRLKGSLFLHRLTTTGSVDVSIAQIGGQLVCENASLDGDDGDALYAQGVRVAQDLVLSNITATGTVDLNGAQIGGQLACGNASLDGKDGDALNAQAVRVGDSLSLRNLTATGTVRVNGAQIGGQLNCMGARLDGKDSEALNAQGVTVGESLLLCTLAATSTVHVVGAEIGGQLDCTGARLNGKDGKALNAHRLRVTQGLIFRDLGAVSGLIDLTSAHVGDLVDDIACWPTMANDLILDGFTYERLSETAPTTLAARAKWLHAGSHWQGEFLPQPYTQLARVLRQMGHAGEARKVLIEREKLLAKHRMTARWQGAKRHFPQLYRQLPALAANALDWCWDRIAFWVAGYGQDARRSILALLLLFGAAATLAHMTWKEGSFAPNSAVVLASPGWAQATARDCFPTALEGCDPNPAQTWANTFTASADQPTQGADWDSFNALGYGVDLVVPFLDLGQTDAWAPSKDRGDWGWWLWFMRWVLAALGWVVTGLGVAAVTGVMQRNQPD